MTAGKQALLAGALVGLVLRTMFGITVAVWSHLNPEADMLALGDLPTLVVYFAAALVFDLGMEIVDASDVRFFVIGVLVWSSLGALTGLMINRGIFRENQRA